MSLLEQVYWRFLGFLFFGFLAFGFLVVGFLVSRFLGLSVSKFFGFLVSWFQTFEVSMIQYYRNSISCFLEDIDFISKMSNISLDGSSIIFGTRILRYFQNNGFQET